MPLARRRDGGVAVSRLGQLNAQNITLKWPNDRCGQPCQGSTVVPL